MTGKTLVDEMLESEEPMESDPKTLALRQAWQEWEGKILKIRHQMIRGEIGKEAASLMSEQASREYSDMEQKINSLFLT